MKNDEERMAFALRFAQSDPAALREGDWLNLREDLVHFLGWNPRWREEIRLEDIKPLQEEVATVLRAIAEAFAPHTPGDWESRMPTLLRLGDISPQEVTKFLGDKKRGIALRVDHVDFLYFDLTDARVLVSASLRDSFLSSLLLLLARLDVTYLRQCPVCSRLFYAEHGRQMFCTPQCASRQGTRRFRAKHKEQENERGRTNYEKKMKKKLGPNIQIKKRIPHRKEA